jgi:hypothetical protein
MLAASLLAGSLVLALLVAVLAERRAAGAAEAAATQTLNAERRRVATLLDALREAPRAAERP